jgi:hypothetical protein
MKIPQLKGFDCFDHDPIDKWVPATEEEVFYSLCLHIGLPDSDGADYFYVDVMTPQAINHLNLGKSLNQRRIIVNPYTWEAVLESVRATLESCAGEDWSQQSGLLAKYFSWEFENYRP